MSPKTRGYINHPFWQAVGILVLAFVFIEYIIPVLPGSSIVPKSVAFQYMATVFVGVLLYVSDNEDSWTLFKQPIHAALVEPRLRLVRITGIALVTLLVGWITFGQVRTSVAAPPNLRSIHPAPPNDITFRGKTITLTAQQPAAAARGIPRRLSRRGQRGLLPELPPLPRRPFGRPRPLRGRLQSHPGQLPG
jgi:hypothetical protein